VVLKGGGCMEISKIDLIGVYELNKMSDVHLVEIVINQSLINIDVSSFTQENDVLPKNEWQTAYDEHFLNNEGTVVVGRFGDQQSLSMFTDTRIAFFMYCIDFNKPLLTQYGNVSLIKPTRIPERLINIIEFIPVD
jgi:hypothetical protein